ncbi:hypothetical protein [Streptomyces caatingaensis]|uniref:hypothetical protein n=1 Tax=Streptomyces caatingaensis TaxID=1678637 RepID=UPI0006727EEA|nr:hypothetical protein [Streptomyces caatingaensis]
MTPIDDLLARALLRDDPRPRPDIVPAAVPRPHDEPSPWPAPEADGRHGANPAAAHDLRALCEAVVAHTASTSLRDFITEKLPEPRGALVVGCILQLNDDDDGSRFWWQYASGAGDNIATYCLYLHHLALGEHDAATWWHDQMRVTTQPPEQAMTLRDGDVLLTDSSLATVLRVLCRLVGRWGLSSRPRTEAVDAVMEYVPEAVAVGYLDHPELELPLPGPHFAECLAIRLAAAAALESVPVRTGTRTPRLDRRPAPAPDFVRPHRDELAHGGPGGRG